MLQALLSGVASIKAQQTRMGAIGNNLANVNTTAYKGSHVMFEDMISQTIAGASRPDGKLGGRNPTQFGLGVLVAGTAVDFQQGSLNSTNRSTDMAIQGNGFLLVSDGTGVSYSRDGSCDLDANGDLVQQATGRKLVGWTADTTGTIDTSKTPGPSSTINIPVGSLNAVQPTTTVAFTGNLDASSTSAANWSTSVRVYDSLGAAHDTNMAFSNHQSPPAGTTIPTGAVASWDWAATENGTSIGDFSTGTNERLYFDSSGNLLNANAVGSITVPGANGAASQPMTVDFSKITQLSTATQVQASNQNGFAAGSLESFQIGSDGVITGTFTNGLTRSLGQIALAVFPNSGGLNRVGNNLWQSSDNSGIPDVGTANTGGRGALNAGFLEQSNVDISNEFTDLIITQRGFQANTKIVTTVDQMLQDLISIMR